MNTFMHALSFPSIVDLIIRLLLFFHSIFRRIEVSPDKRPIVGIYIYLKPDISSYFRFEYSIYYRWYLDFQYSTDIPNTIVLSEKLPIVSRSRYRLDWVCDQGKGSREKRGRWSGRKSMRQGATNLMESSSTEAGGGERARMNDAL